MAGGGGGTMPGLHSDFPARRRRVGLTENQPCQGRPLPALVTRLADVVGAGESGQGHVVAEGPRTDLEWGGPETRVSLTPAEPHPDRCSGGAAGPPRAPTPESGRRLSRTRGAQKPRASLLPRGALWCSYVFFQVVFQMWLLAMGEPDLKM